MLDFLSLGAWLCVGARGHWPPVAYSINCLYLAPFPTQLVSWMPCLCSEGDLQI